MKLGAFVLLLAVGGSFAFARAQEQGSERTETEELGRRLFQQRCSVCHTRATLSVKAPHGTLLTVDRLERSWEGAKQNILNGRNAMPAFKYGLEEKEVDSILEYLKTGPDFMYNGKEAAPAKETRTPPGSAGHGEVLLSGHVKTANGEKMEGVSVSAKADGRTITTTVFSDKDGGFYFPALPAGKYSVWAQSQAYETSKRAVDLAANRKEDFALRPLKDFFKQLSGDQLLTALPEDNAHDKRLKQVFKHDCLGCHETSFILQNRFDEAGWNSVIDVMSMRRAQA